MRPLRRILMTADTVGGVWTYALELIRALGTSGIQVALATMGRLTDPAQRTEASRIGNLVLIESAYKLEWMEDPWRDVEASADWLLTLEKDLAPDLVHLNTYSHGALPWKSPTLMVAHSCVLSWWRAVHGCDAPESWLPYRAAVSAGLKSAGMVVAPSGAMLHAVENLYGRLPVTRVIPNGRSLNVQRLQKDNLIFTAGRMWDLAKNLNQLVAVAPDLPWPVYAAGEISLGKTCCDDHGAVCYLGRLSLDEVEHWLARASIYALPARYEPFGLSVLEAALNGCALVLGDIPSLREIWGDAALYANPASPEELRSALLSLIINPQLLADMASRARSRAVRYSPRAMADSYLQAYESVRNRTAGNYVRSALSNPRGGVPCGS